MTPIPVPFHDDTLWAAQEGKRVQVAVKPICESIGVAWRKQLERIKRDAILSEGITMMVIPSPGGPQETVCLSLELLPGFLFGIDDRRIKDPAVRAKALAFKRECYAVLFRHFFGGMVAEGDLHDEDPFAPQPATGARYTYDTHTFDPETPGSRLLTERQTRLALDQVAEIRLLFGTGPARKAWASLGLIHVPSMAGPDDPEGRDATPRRAAEAGEAGDRASLPARTADVVFDFCRSALDVTGDPDDRMAAAALHDAFRIWCRASRRGAVARTVFYRRMPGIAATLGFEKAKASVAIYAGVALAPHFSGDGEGR